MRPRIRQHRKSDLETAEQQQVRLAFVRERNKRFGMMGSFAGEGEILR